MEKEKISRQMTRSERTKAANHKCVVKGKKSCQEYCIKRRAENNF